MLVTLLPAQLGFRTAKTLGQPLQGGRALVLVDQGKLDRRAAAVDYQDIATGHQASLSEDWAHQPQAKG